MSQYPAPFQSRQAVHAFVTEFLITRHNAGAQATSDVEAQACSILTVRMEHF
jgi:hypothetical protein